MQLEIIGRGPSRQTPDRSLRHWFISTACGDIPPSGKNDLVWNIHKPEAQEEWFKEWPARMDMAAFQPFAREYVEKYGPIFASTASWMLIHAMNLGCTWVLLNGIDLEFGFYENRQRDSLFLVIGILIQKGVKVRHVNSQYLNLGAYELPRNTEVPKSNS